MTHPDPPPKLTWESSRDDLIKDFYRPILKDAILYQRKAGYFSSTSFIGITNEIIDLIERNGRIQLITSPNVSARDKAIWTESVENKEKILEETLLNEIRNDPDGTKLHFWKIMAYMIANEIDGKPQLEIKIALPDPESGLFHEKMGLIHYDDEEKICYVGSNNETYPAWSGQNTERFMAFHSWQGERDAEAIKDNQESFDSFWNGTEPNVKIFSLPQAVKHELLKIRPKSQVEFQESLTKAHESIEKEKGLVEEEVIDKPNEKGLRPYQNIAIDKWIKNDYRGIFAMATGTGKTVTAYGCINKLNKLEERNVTIIACPYTHLVEQWKEANDDYNSYVLEEDQVKLDNNKTRTIVCYGEKKPPWRPEMQTALDEFNNEYFSGGYEIDNLIIFVTHKTLNSEDFKNYILKIKNAKKFLIADEVHEIGSELSRESLLEEYDYRLGLSATPKRHYDEEGTIVLMNYFNNVVYEFELEEAIKKGYLCEYEYHPTYVQLTPSEMDVYDDLTIQIAAKMGKKSRVTEEDENNPEIRRADLVASAESKLEKLNEMVEMLKEEQFSQEGTGIKRTLVYCTSQPSPNLPPGSQTQLQNVQDLLNEKHISHKSITFRDPTNDRAEIIDNLTTGHYDCITAVKCLDQGVDIPSVEKAIIMASSGNPKQYIQRRGRVLRQSKKTGKTKAIIYDILVQSPVFGENSSIRLRERKLVAKELLRHIEFASIALNADEALEIIKPQAELYKIDLETLKKEKDEYIRNLEDPVN